MITRKVIDGVEYEAVRALAFELGITEGRCDGCCFNSTLFDVECTIDCYAGATRYIWRKVDEEDIQVQWSQV